MNMHVQDEDKQSFSSCCKAMRCEAVRMLFKAHFPVLLHHPGLCSRACSFCKCVAVLLIEVAVCVLGIGFPLALRNPLSFFQLLYYSV